MLDRAQLQGRVVTIEQLVGSHGGAAQSVRRLSRDLKGDPRVEFVFVDNSPSGAREGALELAAPKDCTKIGEHLYELLDVEYQNGRITEHAYRRIRGVNRGQSQSRAPRR